MRVLLAYKTPWRCNVRGNVFPQARGIYYWHFHANNKVYKLIHLLKFLIYNIGKFLYVIIHNIKENSYN